MMARATSTPTQIQGRRNERRSGVARMPMRIEATYRPIRYLLRKLIPTMTPKASHHFSFFVCTRRTMHQEQPSHVSGCSTSVVKSVPSASRMPDPNAERPARDCANRPPPRDRANSAVRATVTAITTAGNRVNTKFDPPEMSHMNRASKGMRGGWSTYPHAGLWPHTMKYSASRKNP